LPLYHSLKTTIVFFHTILQGKLTHKEIVTHYNNITAGQEKCPQDLLINTVIVQKKLILSLKLGTYFPHSTFSLYYLVSSYYLHTSYKKCHHNSQVSNSLTFAEIQEIVIPSHLKATCILFSPYLKVLYHVSAHSPYSLKIILKNLYKFFKFDLWWQAVYYSQNTMNGFSPSLGNTNQSNTEPTSPHHGWPISGNHY